MVLKFILLLKEQGQFDSPVTNSEQLIKMADNHQSTVSLLCAKSRHVNPHSTFLFIKQKMWELSDTLLDLFQIMFVLFFF